MPRLDMHFARCSLRPVKKYISLGIILVGLVTVVAVHLADDGGRRTESARAEDLARIRADYYERVGWIRSNPDERSYRIEVGTFLRGYFNQLAEHRGRFKLPSDDAAYLKELEARPKDPDERLEDRKSAWEFEKAIVDLMRSGKYEPLYTATDKGMRLDILSAGVKTVGGEPKIHLPVVLWGAQRETKDESATSGTVTAYVRKKVMASASFRMVWKLYGDQGRLYAEMPVDGDPAQRIDHPERLMPDFPPQMVIGHYDIDLLPAEAAKTDLTVTVASHSRSGGDASAEFKWKLDLPLEWKLRPGQVWKGAETSVRPRSEIEAKPAEP